jgi:hypothetical protein
MAFRYKGRMPLWSPAERTKVEAAGAKFFEQAGRLCASLAVAWPKNGGDFFKPKFRDCPRRLKAPPRRPFHKRAEGH